MSAESPYVRETGYAERYRDRRFQRGSGPRTHRLEVAAVRRLVERAGPVDGPWLDVPSGAGRLTELLPGAAVRADRDPAMVRACDGAWPRVCASAHRLPWSDGAFGGALCMRLMQHLPAAQERIAVLRELRRVTRGPVIVSFFHALSLQHLRRVLRRRLGGRSSRRVAVSLRAFRSELSKAGLELVATAPIGAFFSEQWVVLAAPRRGGPSQRNG